MGDTASPAGCDVVRGSPQPETIAMRTRQGASVKAADCGGLRRACVSAELAGNINIGDGVWCGSAASFNEWNVHWVRIRFSPFAGLPVNVAARRGFDRTRERRENARNDVGIRCAAKGPEGRSCWGAADPGRY